jgi:hypothetical protein
MPGERARLADVTPTRVAWLWPGYVPLGKLTLLDGDPGLGKSTLVLDLAARGSIGGTTPTGEPLASFTTLIVTAEDGAADTIRPRLDKAGADPERVWHIADLTLPDDAAQLAEHVAETGAKLLVVDPIVAHLSDSVRTASDHAVRRALVPLAQIAEEHGCAVVAIRHLRKQVDGPAIYRGGGSIGFAGIARSVLAVGRDPDDEDQAVLMVVKSNLSAQRAPLTYRLTADGPYDPAGVEWMGESAHSTETLLGSPDQVRPQTKVAQLAGEIRVLVESAGGSIGAHDALQALAATGIPYTSPSLVRARQIAGVESEKAGFGEGWVWRLASPKVVA